MIRPMISITRLCLNKDDNPIVIIKDIIFAIKVTIRTFKNGTFNLIILAAI